MQEINSIDTLKSAIQLLEAEQVVNGQRLKEQFYITYESLKPVNLITEALNDIATSPYLIDNILGSAIGLATGYLSKKIFIGGSGNIFKKLLGAVVQYGVTNVVAKHPDPFKSFGQFIFQYFFHKKEKNPETP
jgi:hypothetical protein